MMRFPTLILFGTVLLAGACGGSTSSSTSHSDAGKCAIGALGCACTAGGACDPGGHCDPALHICVSTVGSGGAGGSGGSGPDASAGNGGASGAGAAGSAAASGSAGASGSGGSAGASGSGGSAGASGSGGSTGGTAGAGGTSGSAGTGGSGGSGGVDGIGILPCGSTTCTAPQACCYKYQQVAGSSTYQASWACIDPSTTGCASCTGTACRATLIECHGSADCPAGETCCVTGNGSGTGYASLECQTQCGPGSTICDPNVQSCPAWGWTTMVCNDTAMLPGYHICQLP